MTRHATAVCLVAVLSACAPTAARAPTTREELYVLRSIREPPEPSARLCSADKAGFELFPTDAERAFSFWSVETERGGRVVDAHWAHTAELRGCFGPTPEPARQKFHAEVKLGAISFRGDGECNAVRVDFPQPGMFPVHCWLVLSGLPTPYVGGLLTTNTLTSKAAFGPLSAPPGYTQASIATIRLWK